MSEPYLGQITTVAFEFAPRGYAFADGSQLPIAQNQPLFSLLGTTFGGDGITNFKLPELRGRSPVHADGSADFALGESQGTENVTLPPSSLPAHVHRWPAATGAPAPRVVPASGANFATSAVAPYRTSGTDVATGTVTGNAGGSQPHPNRQPYLTINFIIALVGSFPSQS